MVPIYVAAKLQALDDRVAELVGSAWASKTLSTRNSQWKRFIDFCLCNGLTPLPAELSTILRFVADLSMSCKFTTINNYISALNMLHKFYGYDIDFRGYFAMQLCISGLKRKLGTSVLQKIPLSVAQLTQIHSQLDFSRIENRVMWCAVIFSFRTLLRKSNFLPDPENQSVRIVHRGDIKFTSYGCMVLVKSTKTLRFKERVLEIPLYFVSNPVFDVVTQLKVLFRLIPAEPSHPIFLIPAKAGPKYLTYSMLLSFLKRCVSLINLSPEDVGLHSLRRSGVTYMYSLGIPIEDIRKMGDWRSLAVLLYIASPLERKLAVEQVVSSSFPSNDVIF